MTNRDRNSNPKILSLSTNPIQGRHSKFLAGKTPIVSDTSARFIEIRLQNLSPYGPPKEVGLQNTSTKGGLPLDFINQNGVRLQISSTKKGSHQPKRGSSSRVNFYGFRGTSLACRRLVLFCKIQARPQSYLSWQSSRCPAIHNFPISTFFNKR